MRSCDIQVARIGMTLWSCECPVWNVRPIQSKASQMRLLDLSPEAEAVKAMLEATMGLADREKNDKKHGKGKIAQVIPFRFIEEQTDQKSC